MVVSFKLVRNAAGTDMDSLRFFVIPQPSHQLLEKCVPLHILSEPQTQRNKNTGQLLK